MEEGGTMVGQVPGLEECISREFKETPFLL
jgi:hypothetical protein